MKSAKMFGVVGLAILLFVLVGCGAESDITFNTALGDELALTLGKVTDFVEQVSPVIWQTTVAQVKIDAITSLFWGTFLFGLFIAGVFTARWSIKKHFVKKEDDSYGYDDEWAILAVLLICFLILAFVFGALAFTSGFKMALNPEYYAIEKLLAVLG